MSGALVLAQLASLAAAYAPAVPQPARGALLLASFWFLGAAVGSCLAMRGGE